MHTIGSTDGIVLLFLPGIYVKPLGFDMLMWVMSVVTKIIITKTQATILCNDGCCCLHNKHTSNMTLSCCITNLNYSMLSCFMSMIMYNSFVLSLNLTPHVGNNGT